MDAREQALGLLVVSDLHLSEGRRERTRTFSRNEDFFFDEEFARLLAFYQDPLRWEGARWHLVVNGDFLDLLQVVSVDGAPETLRRDPSRPGYGLRCGEAETIFKLRKVVSGHRRFFEALASFVAAGNRLTILKGNHDVEFHYPGVQAAFVEELRLVYARLPSPPSSSSVTNIAAGAIRFGDWFHYEKGVIWIEHGNRYDPANTFRTWLWPLLSGPASSGDGGTPPGNGGTVAGDGAGGRSGDGAAQSRSEDAEIDLPLGSLFVRYLFNRIESVEPFADNIKPQTEFVRWMLSRHPVTALRFLLGDGRYMLRKLRRAWVSRPAEPQEAEHRRRLAHLADEAGIDRDDLTAVDALRARSVLEETSGFWPVCCALLVRARLFLPLVYAALVVLLATGVLSALQIVSVLVPPIGRLFASAESLSTVVGAAPWVLLAALVLVAGLALRWALAPEEERGPSALLDPAERIASTLGVKYVVMGHTHDAELCELEETDGEYFNTGTWTKVFSEEERLLRKEVQFVFLQGVWKGPGDLRLKLMEWDDAAGEPRLLELFEYGEARRARATVLPPEPEGPPPGERPAPSGTGPAGAEAAPGSNASAGAHGA